MRTFIKYKSDKTGKTVWKEVVLDGGPLPSNGDKMPVEGRLCRVYTKTFHLLGKDESGPWWSGDYLRGPDVDENDTYVEITLIG